MIGNLKNNQTFYRAVAYIYLAAFAIGGIFFNFSEPVYLAFVLISAIFILPKADFGLSVAVVLTMIFERFFTLKPLIIDQMIYKLYPLDIVIVLTIISFVIGLKIKKIKTKFFLGWPEISLLAFMILVAADFARSAYDINADLAVAFSTLKNYAFYPLLYFLTIYIIQTKSQLKNLVHQILIAGVAIIFFVFFGLINGQGLWTEFTPLSTSGSRLLAGTHAFYLVLAGLIALSLIAYNRFRQNSVVGLVLWVWAIGIIGSLMRHLWLASAFGFLALLAVLPMTNKKILSRYLFKNALIALGVTLGLILMANIFVGQMPDTGAGRLAADLENRLLSVANLSQDTSANWRQDLWQSAKDAWLANPIFGAGLGRKIPLEMRNFNTFEEIRNIHNSPLAILVQVGALGFLLFVVFVFSTIKAGFKTMLKNDELAPYYAGIFAGLAALLLASLFQPYFETNLTGIFLWILLGILRTSKIINQNYENPSNQ